MNRSQAHWALLKTSLVVCAVLFSIFCVSILDSRPNGSTLASVELVSDVVKRVPAAIPGLIKESRHPRVVGGFQVMKTPCLGAHTKIDGLETNSVWIRLAADNCNTDDEISETHLENKSNGYVATIFTPTPDKMTSDFIPLAEGPNQFEMNVKTQSGENFKYQWTVDRRPTASN
jgi:hypothetical protein